jgi:biofilm protein TabA
MIFDNISNCDKYENININFKKAFEFLRRDDLKELSPGKYEIDGSRVFALAQVYETKDLESKVYEVHKDYIDIQYMMEGEENIAFTSADNLYIKTPYEKETDCMLLDGEKIFYKLRTGEFFVFFPEEPHMPGVMNAEKKNVKKVVIKIKA